MGVNRHRLLRPLALIVGLVLVVGTAACGNDDTDQSASTTASTTSAVDVGDASADAEAAATATALCEAYGEIDGSEGVDALLELMADDVQVTDAGLGATLTGKNEVRAYVTGDLFAGIDTSECGPTVQRGGWVAGSYTLSNSTTGEGGQGLAAVHVTDGLVDRQINHYTSVPAVAAPPAGLADASVIEDYCQAWADGPDPAAVTALMAPDAVLVVLEPIVGVEAIADYIEQDFPFDRVDCGEEAIEFGEWSALTAGFADTATGLSAEGVNVVSVDDQGRVRSHTVYVEAGA